MIRKDKEISDPEEMAAVIGRAAYCHMSLSDEGRPYGAPLCFGFREGVLYLHSAPKGRKLAIIEKNPKVCVAFVADAAPRPGASPCDWTMTYESVVGFGEAEILEDPSEKRVALGIIAARYDRDWPETGDFPDAELRATAVIRVRLTAMTGKRG
jgi:uncharacterized protein